MANNFASDPNCVALWRFENGALTTDSKGSNTLTASASAPTSDTTNYAEGAGSASFDRANSQSYNRADADLSSGFPLKSGDTTKLITICLWYRYTSNWTNSWRAVAGKFDANKYSFLIEHTRTIVANNIALRYATGNNTYETLSQSPPPDVDSAYNNWWHIAAVIDGVNKTGKLRIWNGTSAYNFTTTFSTAINVSDAAFGISYPAAGWNYIDGQIDEVVVFNRLLSDDEIDQIRSGAYNSGLAVGGLAFGGEVVESYIVPVDSSTGGLAFGGQEVVVTTRADTSNSGLTLGGPVVETFTGQWAVLVKGGTFRINNIVYTLSNTMTYPGVGAIAAIVQMTAPPSVPGNTRYDLLVIGENKVIDLLIGAEAVAPTIPSTPADHVKLDHVYRYVGQTKIAQSDIGY